MHQRLATLILLALLLVVQTQIWFGRGSVSQVQQIREDLQTQQMGNQQAQLVNDRLAADIKDLKEGLEMVEEKARMELGMVKANEIYVQVDGKGLQ